MKKNLISIFVFLTVAIAVSPQAEARGADNRRWGLGINVGEPLGFDTRLYLFDKISLNLIVGYGFGEEGFILQPSALFHLRDIVDYDGRNWSLVPYFGAGIKTGVDLDGKNDGDGIIGMRFPLGTSFVLQDGEFEISLEFAPGAEFAPETEFDATGGIGLRYYFF